MAEKATRAQKPPLTAKEERVVLGLMQQGKSNLAIINHFTTQDMELTLEQVQRIRELAGLENAAMVTPIKPSVAAVYSAQDVVESMRKSFGKSAQYVDEPEPVHVFGVRSTRAPATQKELRMPPIQRKGSSSSLSSDTSSLSVGPVLKRERSVVASTSARATSGLFVMLSRHLGGLWGTLLGMAIYFVALYCAFMLVTHFFFITISMILSNKLLTSLIALVLTYLYLTLVRGEPWYLSQASRDTVQFYSLHAAVMALQKLGLGVAYLRSMISGTPLADTGHFEGRVNVNNKVERMFGAQLDGDGEIGGSTALERNLILRASGNGGPPTATHADPATPAKTQDPAEAHDPPGMMTRSGSARRQQPSAGAAASHSASSSPSLSTRPCSSTSPDASPKSSSTKDGALVLSPRRLLDKGGGGGSRTMVATSPRPTTPPMSGGVSQKPRPSLRSRDTRDAGHVMERAVQSQMSKMGF